MTIRFMRNPITNDNIDTTFLSDNDHQLIIDPSSKII